MVDDTGEGVGGHRLRGTMGWGVQWMVVQKVGLESRTWTEEIDGGEW